MKRNILLLFLPLVILLAGCEKKFLESNRTGEVILSDTRDYDLLLNSDKLVSAYSYPVLLLSDDVQWNPAKISGTAFVEALYTWQDDIFQDQNPILWTTQYENINQYNVILDEIGRASGGTVTEKNVLRAEAKFGRAFSHFVLLNLYAKQYDAVTSATDPGIPYVTTTDMYAANPGRSTVKETYNKIIKDVTEALVDLPEKSAKNHRASKVAAHGFLSRVYLYTGQYDLAIEQADLATAIDQSILNYRQPGFRKPELQFDVELVYLRALTEPLAGNLQPTAVLLSLLPATDIRKKLYAPSATSMSALFTIRCGITHPEILLNKAEALLRKTSPDINGALLLLNKLHALRDNAHTDYVTADVGEALTWVLNERRRELVNSGFRWFDMRRLAKEGRYPKLTRTWTGVQHSLEPDSKKFTLMIPGTVISFNPGMPQNER